MGKTIALVACVSKKNDTSMAASELYISDWFIKASAYAQQIADEWYILSALYGLITPEQVVGPYDVTLTKIPAKQRRIWALKVALDLEKVLSPGDRVILLAGNSYREYIIEPIQNMGCKVEIPMDGMRIGEQLRWLKYHLD